MLRRIYNNGEEFEAIVEPFVLLLQQVLKVVKPEVEFRLWWVLYSLEG
jgi:hypothetical protein